ncbi:hypothetical protein DdX_19017 [Ditylenchus destructor]|uniref:Uncharacterized protein n=1 Tax=Ditylenchus destructor TaxID=166010 RepID=A0AAD4MJL4_9BILA|nr:hypothetical protein DdX_19017 [Ditylenchus destructor]
MSHKLRSTYAKIAGATLEQTQNPWKLEEKNQLSVNRNSDPSFRLLSRRELCQLIYPISNQVYTIATSSRLLPVVHSIDSMCFDELNNIDAVSIHYLDREIENWNSKQMIVDEFLATMPNPGKFIRFQEIAILRCPPSPLVEYLREASESFVGCRLELFIVRSDNPSRDTDSLHEQMKYLLRNVFHSPTWVQLGSCHGLSNLPILHAGVIPKCNRLEIRFSKLDNCTQATNNELLDWLTAKPNNEIAGNEKRHLLLERYPMSNILDMIQQVRNDFEGATEIQTSDFVITFGASRESIRYCLKDDSGFSVDNTLTGERLTLFNRIPENEWNSPSHVSRLWRRRVTNETEDAVKFSFLLGETKFLMDDKVEFDLALYSFPYCRHLRYRDIG